MKAGSDILWQPSQERIENSRLTHYTNYLNDKYKLSFDSYEDLRNWSVISNKLFWSTLWDYFELKGDKGESVLTGDSFIESKWFSDSKLNFAENMLRYAFNEPDKVALIERGEDGRRNTYSYKELYNAVASLAEHLKSEGIQKGDVIAGILPNSAYATISMLATTTLGAVWTSCSPDFGINGILDRFSQTTPKIIIACNGYHYGGKTHDCTEKIAAVSDQLRSVKKLMLCKYIGSDNVTDAQIETSKPTIIWDSIIKRKESEQKTINFQRFDFNHPVYILYSSGTTGKPKCIVHGAGGTLIQHVKELALHTDVKSDTHLFYYTTCGWMMWNWLVTGLALGATLVLYDGSPFHPQSVLFDLIDSEKIDVFGGGAKFYSATEKFGLEPMSSHSLSSLKSVLSTGSPLSHESFEFIYNSIKKDICLSSISGGTDIISCFALGNNNLPVRKGELQCIGLGMDVAFVDDNCSPLTDKKGELVCRTPFPSAPIGFWNDIDKSRYKAAYFSRFENIWAHGDYGEISTHNHNGQIGVLIHGRSDAVLNPGGVRIGTAEIYRQVEKIDEVFEAITIGQTWQDDVRVILFVRLKEKLKLDDKLIKKIKLTIKENTTPRHVPAKIIQVADIPRTLSGKIVELAVRQVVHGEEVKNTEALANPEALKLFKDIKELTT